MISPGRGGGLLDGVPRDDHPGGGLWDGVPRDDHPGMGLWEGVPQMPPGKMSIYMPLRLEVSACVCGC